MTANMLKPWHWVCFCYFLKRVMGQTSGDFPLPTSATTELEVYDDSGT